MALVGPGYPQGALAQEGRLHGVIARHARGDVPARRQGVLQMVLRVLEVPPVQGHVPDLPVAGPQEGRIVAFTAQRYQLGAELPRWPEFGAEHMGHEQRPPAVGRLAPPARPRRQRPGPRQRQRSIRVGEPPHHQPHRKHSPLPPEAP